MKKFAIVLLSALSMALVACGPSKLEIQEMAVQSDVVVEVRQVLNDSISHLLAIRCT